MLTRDITYTVGDRTMTGYLADGSGGKPAPGVLVCHQGGGLAEHERERARMLAGLGYVAFCADVYGEAPTSRDHMMAMLNGLADDRALWDERILAAIAQLKALPNVDAARLAAIGFCFGGMTVIEAVRCSSELKCVVAFHAGLMRQPESDTRPVTGKVMVCAGQKDPLVTEPARNRFLRLMAEANADLQYINYSEAGHSFTDKAVDAANMPGFNYNAAADRRSWAAMRDLFDETFG
jgi:dienelactone hydrolase